IQSSFSNIGRGESQLYSLENGFVNAAINGYNHHHHLIIRPEDVWFAILSQLNLFVKLNAEQVRFISVAHQGQKSLEIKGIGTRGACDFGKVAEMMTDEIIKNIVQASADGTGIICRRCSTT
ncbi:protein of unknown function (DUF4419) domain containing protein, partial [Elaphomyces granulatus]